jgi:hypothetical protein
VAPGNWPKGFTYASTSVSSDVHPTLLQHLFATGNPADATRISPCIEHQCVHPAIQIQQLVPPHPLGGQEVFEGHPQHGVFAVQPIAKGVEIGEYVGEIQMGAADSGQGGVYCWRILVNELILNVYSRKIANELSFINDFRGIGEAPNVQTTLIIHRGHYYFGYETIRDIGPTEELLIDYGASWEKHFSK